MDAAVTAADGRAVTDLTADVFEQGSGSVAFDTAGGLEMVRHAVNRLATIPSRRKAVLWFSEGVAIDIRSALANPGADRVAVKIQQVLQAAFDGNVA